MDFDAILDQAIAMLQRRGRLTYGALKRQFQLDEEYLADLKAELIDWQRVAVEEDGKVLVWTGGGAPSTLPHLQSPASSIRHPIWPSAFGLSKPYWKRGVELTVSARPSPPSLPISKARQP